MKVQIRRERFFSESLKLIHEKGYKATTMRDIAKQLDFKVANVYNYIESKQSLLESYLFGISGEFHKGIDHIIESSYSPKEKLKAVITLHVQLTSQKPYEVALLVNEWRNLEDKDGRNKLNDFLEERTAYESKVRRVVKEGIKSKQLRSMDLEIATHAILSSVRWLYNWYLEHSDSVNPIELEKQLTDFIFKGMEK